MRLFCTDEPQISRLCWISVFSLKPERALPLVGRFFPRIFLLEVFFMNLFYVGWARSCFVAHQMILLLAFESPPIRSNCIMEKASCGEQWWVHVALEGPPSGESPSVLSLSLSFSPSRAMSTSEGVSAGCTWWRETTAVLETTATPTTATATTTISSFLCGANNHW